MNRWTRAIAIISIAVPAFASTAFGAFLPLRVSACGTVVDGKCVDKPIFVGWTKSAQPIYAGNILNVAVATVETMVKKADGTGVGAGVTAPVEPGTPVGAVMTLNGVSVDDCCLSLDNGGDACMTYTCGSNTKNWWFVVGNWSNMVAGAVSGAVLQPINPPRDGHFYNAGVTFNSVRFTKSNYYMCYVGSFISASSDDATFAPRFDPSGQASNSTGSSQTVGVGASYGPVGATYSFTQADQTVRNGGWDSTSAKSGTYGAATAFTGSGWNDCPQYTQSDAGTVVFDFDSKGTNEISASFGQQWGYGGYSN
jgi:hypothetical protein